MDKDKLLAKFRAKAEECLQEVLENKEDYKDRASEINKQILTAFSST